MYIYWLILFQCSRPTLRWGEAGDLPGPCKAHGNRILFATDEACERHELCDIVWCSRSFWEYIFTQLQLWNMTLEEEKQLGWRRPEQSEGRSWRLALGSRVKQWEVSGCGSALCCLVLPCAWTIILTFSVCSKWWKRHLVPGAWRNMHEVERRNMACNLYLQLITCAWKRQATSIVGMDSLCTSATACLFRKEHSTSAPWIDCFRDNAAKVGRSGANIRTEFE